MDWSYIAGFYDGEGCIHLNRTHYVITVAQSNPHSPVLFEIQHFLDDEGITSRMHERKKQQPQHHDSKNLVITSAKDVATFLGKVCHLLIVKRKEGEAALEYTRSQLARWDERAQAVNAAVEEYKQGVSQNVLCHKYKMSNTAFKNLLIARGIELRSRSLSVKMACPTRKRKHGDEALQRAYEMYSEGENHRAVAQATGIYRGTLRMYMKRNGLKSRTPKEAYFARPQDSRKAGLDAANKANRVRYFNNRLSQIEEAVNEYQQGLSLANISKRVHIAPPTMKKYLTLYGVPIRQASERSKLAFKNRRPRIYK